MTFLRKVWHHLTGVPSPSERGAYARRRAWARMKCNLSWVFNFRRCDCEFYVGKNCLGKCHNCGGRVDGSHVAAYVNKVAIAMLELHAKRQAEEGIDVDQVDGRVISE